MVVKVGFGFISAIALFALIQFHFEDKNQRQSFKIASTTLPAEQLKKPLGQRQAKLLKRKDVYSWRAILWVNEDGMDHPKIWRADILKDTAGFRRIDSELTDYEQSKAWNLELFEDVSNSPGTAP